MIIFDIVSLIFKARKITMRGQQLVSQNWVGMRGRTI